MTHWTCLDSRIGARWMLVATLVFLAVIPLGLIGAAAPATGEIAAVFPPWWRTERAFAAASAVGVVRSAGGLGSVMLVAAADAPTRAALRQAGAWLLLDAGWIGGCVSAAAQLGDAP